MGRAIECDACGALVAWRDAVQLDVHVPTASDTAAGWSDLDICRACMERPMIEVLMAACDDCEATFNRLKATATEKR